MTIKEQITNAQKGDQNAFTFLLDKYWNEVYAFILKRTENETNAEDITIITFAKAFDKIKSYNDEFQFNTWLITIARNTLIDKIRAHKLHINYLENTDLQNLNIADSSLSAEEKLIQKQEIAQVQKYIRFLKPNYQKVIQLRYFEEMSYQEIALTIGEPLASVKIRLLRAKNLLANTIKAK